MAKNGLDDLIKKLDRIENHLAEEIAPEVNELLKESVRFSLIDWYNDYDPEDYKRTYNFMNILNNTKTRSDSLTNQRVPGITATKIVLFLVITK